MESVEKAKEKRESRKERKAEDEKKEKRQSKKKSFREVEVDIDETTVDQHHQHVLENEEVEALAHKLSLVDVMLSLQKEVFKEEYDTNKPTKDGEEEQPRFVEENPGCWIFGHGDIVDLPHEFSNPTLVTRFCCSLLVIMLCCTLFRLFWISLVIFVERIHTYMYSAEFYNYPLMVCFVLHVVVNIFTHLSMFRKYFYIVPLNLITFFVAELIFTGFQVFLSLGFERAVQLWYVNLNLYEDYKNEGYDARKPEFWVKLRLSPGVILVIANLQIALNLTCALVMDIYTTSRVGSTSMFRMLTYQSLLTTLMASLLIMSFSYRVSHVWDNFQVWAAGGWAVVSSLLFIHYLERIMLGQMLRLRGMRWADICYAAIRTVFV